ncbi:MAG TPA: SAM-dependent methyltransferase, partial [Dongiaceae bacterium]
MGGSEAMISAETARVWGIGVGPGDPELLTLKGAARLREADVVLYDDLASGAILDLARPGANLV